MSNFVFQDTTLKRLADKIASTFDINDPSAYKENLLKVELAFEEFNFEKIAEKPGYTVSTEPNMIWIVQRCAV